jgi:TRAP-type C4-dicarboxylate transport system permease large subunit
MGMGCLIDGFSMIVMTTPIVLPLIKAAGFDPIWFGVYIVMMIELAQVTPPVGFNLFVISSLNNDDILAIAKSSAPFFLLLCLATALITIFPEVVLVLPQKMIGAY